MSLRVCHVLRPAEGGMLSQVRSLLDGDSLLAAPPAVLARLTTDSAPYPLSVLGSLRAQGHSARCLARWVKGRADLLHGHGLARAPLFALAAKASGLPLVVTLHNLVPRLSLAELLAARAALSVAKKIICVSEAVSASAAEIAPARRRIVVYNGVEPGRAEPQAGEAVLCVARLSREKGVDVLVEAMQHLPGARLLIAGDGPEREGLREVAGPNVELLGFVDDVPSLLSRAALLVAPSREEGLGLSALEAMAAGVPVVASRVGGLKEVVAEGESGLLVPPDDPAALAEAIKTLLADPERRKEMGRAGKRRVAEKFSIEAMRERTRTVWEEATR